MLTKRELKNIFSEYNFTPLKRFGGNYLIDANVKDKIISAARVTGNDLILEIGPGLGALTIDLASTGASVFAVEKDVKAFAILKELVGKGFPNLKLFNEDILEFDIGKMPEGGKIKVVGNLPYYITTPIIEYLIGRRDALESMLLVMQKEVADRLLAGPGSEGRGSISCFVQYYTSAQYIHTIKRSSFYPEPEVDSSLVRFSFLERPAVEVKDEKLFFRVIRGSFNQRRKSIINSLSRKEVLDMPKEKLTQILEKAGVSPAVRPEDLSLSDFAKICTAII